MVAKSDRPRLDAFTRDTWRRHGARAARRRRLPRVPPRLGDVA